MQSETDTFERIDWLDYLRLAAASWVMLFHFFVVGAHPKISGGISDFGIVTEIMDFGPMAVQIFLMMSGLVITLSMQSQSGAVFATRRVARIYPMFLACMILTTLLSPFGPERFHITVPQFFANLAINAPALGYEYVDAVYWSLVVEVAFYLAMLLVILAGGIARLQWVIAIWVLLQLAAGPLPWRLPLLGPDYYFLAAGSVVALLYQRRNERLNLVLLAISLLLCVRGAMLKASSHEFDPVIASVLTVLVFALFLFMRTRNPTLPFAARIGSMTYPLYLLHFHIGLTLMYWWINEANKWWLVAGVSLAMICLAFAIDDMVQFRMRRFWRRLAGQIVGRPLARLESLLARSKALRSATPTSSA